MNVDLERFKVGIDLVNELPKDNLKHIFVLSEGSFINESELTKVINKVTKKI